MHPTWVLLVGLLVFGGCARRTCDDVGDDIEALEADARACTVDIECKVVDLRSYRAAEVVCGDVTALRTGVDTAAYADEVVALTDEAKERCSLASLANLCFFETPRDARADDYEAVCSSGRCQTVFANPQ